MCRAGLRHCEDRWTAARRGRDNARRRFNRNTRLAAAHADDDPATAEKYAALAELAAADLARYAGEEQQHTPPPTVAAGIDFEGERDRFLRVHDAYYTYDGGEVRAAMTVPLPDRLREQLNIFATSDLGREWIETDEPLAVNCNDVAEGLAQQCRDAGIDAQPVMGLDYYNQNDRSRPEDARLHAVTCVHHEGQHLHIDYSGRQFAVTQDDLGDDPLDADPLATANIPTPLVWDANALPDRTPLVREYEWDDRGPGEPGTLAFRATTPQPCPTCGEADLPRHACPGDVRADIGADAASWRDGFTDVEKDAWDWYGSVVHVDINQKLRDGQPLTGDEQRIVDGLDATLARAPRTTQPITVFRGISTLRLDRHDNQVGLPAREWIRRNAPIGSTVTFPGYLSTSLSSEQAGHFAGTRDEYAVEGVAFSIETRHGSLTTESREMEVTLPRGSRFEVVGVREVILDEQRMPLIELRETG